MSDRPYIDDRPERKSPYATQRHSAVTVDELRPPDKRVEYLVKLYAPFVKGELPIARWRARGPRSERART